MRWGTRALVAGLVAAATLTAAAGSACACSCVGVTDDEALRNSAAVFVGTLLEVRPPTVMLSSTDPSRFVFDVEAVYKGEVFSTQSIVSASDGASCGLELGVGDRAVVFATSGEYSPDAGEFGASLCGGTRRFGAIGFPQGFGEGMPPAAGSSPIGEDDSLPSVVARNWYWILGGAVLLVVAVVTGRRRRHSPAPMGE